jgi:hypothetical protein
MGKKRRKKKKKEKQTEVNADGVVITIIRLGSM